MSISEYTLELTCVAAGLVTREPDLSLKTYRELVMCIDCLRSRLPRACIATAGKSSMKGESARKETSLFCGFLRSFSRVHQQCRQETLRMDATTAKLWQIRFALAVLFVCFFFGEKVALDDVATPCYSKLNFFEIIG